jgi:hypothetical protein
MLTRQVLYNEGGGSNGFSMYVEGGKVYCLAWKVEVEEFECSKCVNCCRSMVSHCFCFDQSASDGYHFKGYLNGVNNLMRVAKLVME